VTAAGHGAADSHAAFDIRHYVRVGGRLDAIAREGVERLAIRHESRSTPWEESGWKNLAELGTVQGRTGSSKAEVCDAVAKVLASGFADRTLTFEFCDRLINDAFAWITDGLAHGRSDLTGYPDFFWRVYLAFEEGEFVHRGDSPEVDSAEKYARPAIAEVIRDLSLD
jgi:hypothetical protein